MNQEGGIRMYERKVTLPLTEDEWRALCANAKSEDRTPKLHVRYLVRQALGLTVSLNDNGAGHTRQDASRAVVA